MASSKPRLCCVRINPLLRSKFCNGLCAAGSFQEVRPHLGVETPRQWSDKAIARTTPIFLGLFSWVTLLVNQSQTNRKLPIRQTAWYAKSLPTFSDAMALWSAVKFGPLGVLDVVLGTQHPNIPTGFTQTLV